MRFLSDHLRWGPLRALALAAVVTGLAGCSPPVDNRGNMPLDEVVERIKPGQQSREEVAALLGSPSTRSSIGQEIWYYIGQREERIAFFHPDILERKIVEIRFDGSGRVAAVRQYDESDAKEVAVVDRVTPTKGKKLTFLQQIIGNIGRFNNRQGEN